MSLGTTAEMSMGVRRRDEKELVARGNQRVMPVLVKVGIAIALSFAGFVVCQLRPRFRPLPRPRSPQSSPSVDAESATGGKNSCSCLQEEIRVLKSEEPSMQIIDCCSTTAAATMMGLSPTSNTSGDDVGFLLPEFADFVMQEFEVKSRELETTLIAAMSEEPEMQEETAMKEEIAHLRELVLSLQEKERTLELQLLDYYGLKEKEASVRELENRLKISAMEGKMYSLKIDSLQSDNQRLQAQLAEFSSAMKELEAARAEINLLERKMKLDEEKTKEILASLHQKITYLQQKEQKDVENNAVVERKLKRLEELEKEIVQLRMMNSRLAEENLDLSSKLVSAQMSLASVLEGEKVKEFEEANRLRKANENLMEEIEQLQTARCTDVEELVYLRWVNACLRYEMRNYQPPIGKTVARDLSRCLSPKSEEKAKQLILEYANLGTDERGLNLVEVDSDYSSSSQASAGDLEDITVDSSSSLGHSKSKRKFLSKLKKLVLGNGNKNNRISTIDRTTSSGNSERRASISTCSIDDIIGRDSYDSSSSCVIDEVATATLLGGMEAQTLEKHHKKDLSFQLSPRLSLDIQSLRRLDQEAREDKGTLHKSDHMMSCRYKKISFSEDISTHPSHNNPTDQEDSCIPEKAKIKKFADVLRSSRGIPKLNKRSASCRY
ncbi:protein CHUP1, chloroplastic [Canna indica]|uniref:Protein CHUP1, chloroplastic n=1 Tax=Canna indica TaxID=4628 RepID=A0AAQ3JVR7_9LILI|nr:protein CHUP1, chloroplastic [Canna indica]